MGVFQRVNDWLSDRGDKPSRGADPNRIHGGAYYASSEAQQAYGGMRAPAPEPAPAADSRAMGGDTGRMAPVDRFSGDASDKYGGRVPYRSQRDMQTEADSQRQQMEEQARRQQAAQQRPTQPFSRPQAQPGMQQPAYQQAAYQQPSNVVPFPVMFRGPDGNHYAHAEYVMLLRSRNECTRVIEYIKANASVFLNMEFIANDSERQRCVDMLSGAAYTLGCRLSKISQRGIYLISSPSVYVEIDPAMQRYAATPEAQGYVRPEYAAPSAYAAEPQGYVAAGYTQGGGRAFAGMQRAAGYGDAATATRAGRFGAAQQAAGYGLGSQGGGMDAQAGGMGAAQQAAGARTAPFAAAGAGYGMGAAQQAAGAHTAPFAAASAAAQQTAGARTAPFAAASAAAQQTAGAHTAPYAAAPAGGYGFGGQAGGQGAQAGGAGAAQQAAGGQRRPGAPFGMQGAFVRSGDGQQGR